MGKRRVLKKFLYLTGLLGILSSNVAPLVAAAETLSSEETNATSEVLQTSDTTASSGTATTESTGGTAATTEQSINSTTASTEATTESSAPVAKAAKAATTDAKTVTILGTSDVHGQLWNWSYEDNKEAQLGLAHVSGAVNALRGANQNGTVLIDNGDMIQGTIMTDDLYNVTDELKSVPHPMIAAMNYMGYDSMTLGNHEFNFGIEQIKKIESDANFPILSANTYVKETGTNYVGRTTTKDLDLDADGTNDIKVGIVGMTTPHIPMWDGAKVDSLSFTALREEATKAVKELEDAGADVVVASIHAGREDADPAAAANSVIQNVEGIDAFVLGHDHSSYAYLADGPNGTKVPIGGPQDTGVDLVKIDLQVSKENDEWKVGSSTSEIVKTKDYPADEGLKQATKQYHDKTVSFISDPIGQASADFLPAQTAKGIPEAQMVPTAMISLVNNVQRKYTGADIAASALFKEDSNLNAGDINYANVFDIYKYANTLVSAKITGAKLLEYMENNASYYQQPQEGDVTLAFNPAIRLYNYDIFSGVDYEIDVSKPVGERITATINGAPVDLAKEYTIAVNNYRYEGLLSAGIVTEGSRISDSDPKSLRSFIADYIKEKATIDPTVEIEDNWKITGLNFDEYYHNEAVRLLNEGQLTTTSTEDTRTPNIKAITIDEVKAIVGEKPEKFTIMHTNDVHGRFEENSGSSILGSAKLKGFKDAFKPNLLIDVGDSFQGLPVSNASKGEDMAKIMNAVGYDAMVVGNHEFDFGLDVATGYKDQLNFPILSANTYKDNARLFDASTIIDKDGVKAAVIGLTTPETAVKTHPKNVEGVTFTDPLPEAKKVIDELKKDSSIKVFVVAGHLGVDETTPIEWRGSYVAEELSKAYPDLNLVFLDGHSHTAFEDGQHFGNVVYAQTGTNLNNVGVVSLDLDDASKNTAKLHPYDELKDYPADPTVQGLVDDAVNRFAEANSEVVVQNNPVDFQGERDFVRTRETNLGNVIGDSMLAYGQEGFSYPTDFAVTNGGGIRTSIAKGPVTKGDIIAVLPFGNSISQIAVKGSQIKEMFEYSLRSEVQTDEKTGETLYDEKGQPLLGANGGFLHVSSTVRLYFDSDKKGSNNENTEKGERVLQIEIYDREAKEFKKLKNTKTYYMATNDFLAAGGDGYTMLGGEREEGPSLDEVFTEFLKSATQLRLYRAESNVDLTKYATQVPYERIIPMSEEAFKEMTKPADGQDGQDGQDGGNGEDGDKGPAGDKGPTGDKGPDGKPGANGTTGGGKNIPKFGTQGPSYLAAAAGAAIVSIAGYKLIKRRKSA